MFGWNMETRVENSAGIQERIQQQLTVAKDLDRPPDDQAQYKIIDHFTRIATKQHISAADLEDQHNPTFN
eukprot:13324940-Ditylum_brightwellii.AAC.1